MMRAFHSVYHLFKIATLALFLCAFGDNARGMDVPPPETDALVAARQQFVDVNGERLYWILQKTSATSVAEGLYFFYAELKTKLAGPPSNKKIDFDPQSPHVATGIPSGDGRVFVYSKFDVLSSKSVKYEEYALSSVGVDGTQIYSWQQRKPAGPTAPLGLPSKISMDILLTTFQNPIFIFNPATDNQTRLAIDSPKFEFMAKISFDASPPEDKNFCVSLNKVYVLKVGELCKHFLTNAPIAAIVENDAIFLQKTPLYFKSVGGNDFITKADLEEGGSLYLAPTKPFKPELFDNNVEHYTGRVGEVFTQDELSSINGETGQRQKRWLTASEIFTLSNSVLFPNILALADKRIGSLEAVIRPLREQLEQTVSPSLLTRVLGAGRMPDRLLPISQMQEFLTFLGDQGYSVGGGGGGGLMDLGEGDADAQMRALLLGFKDQASEVLAAPMSLASLDSIQSFLDRTRTQMLIMNNPIVSALKEFNYYFKEAGKVFTKGKLTELRAQFKKDLWNRVRKESFKKYKNVEEDKSMLMKIFSLGPTEDLMGFIQDTENGLEKRKKTLDTKLGGDATSAARNIRGNAYRPIFAKKFGDVGAEEWQRVKEFMPSNKELKDQLVSVYNQEFNKTVARFITAENPILIRNIDALIKDPAFKGYKYNDTDLDSLNVQQVTALKKEFYIVPYMFFIVDDLNKKQKGFFNAIFSSALNAKSLGLKKAYISSLAEDLSVVDQKIFGIGEGDDTETAINYLISPEFKLGLDNVLPILAMHEKILSSYLHDADQATVQSFSKDLYDGAKDTLDNSDPEKIIEYLSSTKFQESLLKIKAFFDQKSLDRAIFSKLESEDFKRYLNEILTNLSGALSTERVTQISRELKQAKEDIFPEVINLYADLLALELNDEKLTSRPNPGDFTKAYFIGRVQKPAAGAQSLEMTPQVAAYERYEAPDLGLNHLKGLFESNKQAFQEKKRRDAYVDIVLTYFEKDVLIKQSLKDYQKSKQAAEKSFYAELESNFSTAELDASIKELSKEKEALSKKETALKNQLQKLKSDKRVKEWISDREQRSQFGLSVTLPRVAPESLPEIQFFIKNTGDNATYSAQLHVAQQNINQLNVDLEKFKKEKEAISEQLAPLEERAKKLKADREKEIQAFRDRWRELFYGQIATLPFSIEEKIQQALNTGDIDKIGPYFKGHQSIKDFMKTLQSLKILSEGALEDDLSAIAARQEALIRDTIAELTADMSDPMVELNKRRASIETSTLSTHEVFKDPAMQWHMEKRNKLDFNTRLFLKIKKRILGNSPGFSKNVSIPVHLEFLKDLDDLFKAHSQRLQESPEYYTEFVEPYFREDLERIQLDLQKPTPSPALLKSSNTTLVGILTRKISLIRDEGGDDDIEFQYDDGDGPEDEQSPEKLMAQAVKSDASLDQLLALFFRAGDNKQLQLIALKAFYEKLEGEKEQVKKKVLDFALPDHMQDKYPFLMEIYKSAHKDSNPFVAFSQPILNVRDYFEKITPALQKLISVDLLKEGDFEGIKSSLGRYKLSGEDLNLLGDYLKDFDIRRLDGFIEALPRLMLGVQTKTAYVETISEFKHNIIETILKDFEPLRTETDDLRTQRAAIIGQSDAAVASRFELDELLQKVIQDSETQKHQIGLKFFQRFLDAWSTSEIKSFETSLFSFIFDFRKWMENLLSLTHIDFSISGYNWDPIKMEDFVPSRPVNAMTRPLAIKGGGIIKIEADEDSGEETGSGDGKREEAKGGVTQRKPGRFSSNSWMTQVVDTVPQKERDKETTRYVGGSISRTHTDYGFKIAEDFSDDEKITSFLTNIANSEFNPAYTMLIAKSGKLGKETVFKDLLIKTMAKLYANKEWDMLKLQKLISVLGMRDQKTFLRSQLISIFRGDDLTLPDGMSLQAFEEQINQDVIDSSDEDAPTAKPKPAITPDNFFIKITILLPGSINDEIDEFIFVQEKKGGQLLNRWKVQKIETRSKFVDLAIEDMDLVTTVLERQQQYLRILESRAEADSVFAPALAPTIKLIGQRIEILIKTLEVLEAQKRAAEDEKIKEIDVGQKTFLKSIMIKTGNLSTQEDRVEFMKEKNAEFEQKIRELKANLSIPSASEDFTRQIQAFIIQLQAAQAEFNAFMNLDIVKNMPAILQDLAGLNSNNQTGLDFITEEAGPSGLGNFARAISFLTSGPPEEYTLTNEAEYLRLAAPIKQKTKDSIWLAKTGLIVKLQQIVDKIMTGPDNARLKDLIEGQLLETAHLIALRKSFIEHAVNFICADLTKSKTKLAYLKLKAFLNISPDDGSIPRLNVSHMGEIRTFGFGSEIKDVTQTIAGDTEIVRKVFISFAIPSGQTHHKHWDLN